jgi:hypothetical protein
MKPKEVAETKTERLYEELFDSLGGEVAKLRGEANLHGALFSTKLYVHIRILSIAKMETLQKSAVRFYIEALGHNLDLAATKDAISNEVGMFFEQCKMEFFVPGTKMLGLDQVIASFDEASEQLIRKLDDELELAVHEAKKAAPSFWKDKKHDILLAVISAIFGAVVTLVTLWLTKKLNLGNP